MIATYIFKSLQFALPLFLAYSPASATFNINSKDNVVVYYGSTTDQLRLADYCTDDSIDVIVLSFVDLFPQQANGYPGINFGNQCSDEVYPGPGYNGVNNATNNQLYKCPNLQQDLYTCRQNSKVKFLLSLGGGTDGYQLTGASDGTAFAKLLWTMFGPRQEALVAAGLPRPFDYNDVGFSVDGFDLDIELASTDNSAGYKALVSTLKQYYSTSHGAYYITASPQCVVPDSNMGQVITSMAFDMLFIQFYNTDACSARTWANANEDYTVGSTPNTAGFTYDTWTSWLAHTASKNAKLFIGLPGSADAASTGDVLTVPESDNLVNAYYCRKNFAGVSIWTVALAAENVYSANNKNYYQNIKLALESASQSQQCSTSSSASASATSSRSSSSITSTDGTTTTSSTTTSFRTVTVPHQTAATSSTSRSSYSRGHAPTSLSQAQTSQSSSAAKAVHARDYIGSEVGSSTLSITTSTTTSATSSSSLTSSTATSASFTTQTTSSTSQTAGATAIVYSTDGSCGPTNGGKTCRDSCCSKWGYCGNGDGWCGSGCQSAFGTCSSTS